MSLADTVAALRATFPNAEAVPEFRGETAIIVPKDSLKDFLRHCKDECGFDYLVDISSLDHMGEEPRFMMVYELYSYRDGHHLRVKSPVSEDDLTVDTVADLWPTADWHEREVFDMMGIEFKDHPDLRRILMWDGYPYFPLRKDFPLAGKPSELAEVAFSDPAPLAGGPFVTPDGGKDTAHREPRSRA
ncbi:MAG: NADH-quinone oxidoreductase subunit C [Verrucomicrobiota bacterium]